MTIHHLTLDQLSILADLADAEPNDINTGYWDTKTQNPKILERTEQQEDLFDEALCELESV